MHANLVELEKKLWSAADELRANSELKSSEYSVPVLGLIFLKYADARHFKFLKEEVLIVPDQRTADLFEKHIGKMRELIRRLTKKNQNLRQTRDLLLPKLISGEVAV